MDDVVSVVSAEDAAGVTAPNPTRTTHTPPRTNADAEIVQKDPSRGVAVASPSTSNEPESREPKISDSHATSHTQQSANDDEIVIGEEVIDDEHVVDDDDDGGDDLDDLGDGDFEAVDEEATVPVDLARAVYARVAAAEAQATVSPEKAVAEAARARVAQAGPAPDLPSDVSAEDDPVTLNAAMPNVPSAAGAPVRLVVPPNTARPQSAAMMIANEKSRELANAGGQPIPVSALSQRDAIPDMVPLADLPEPPADDAEAEERARRRMALAHSFGIPRSFSNRGRRFQKQAANDVHPAGADVSEDEDRAAASPQRRKLPFVPRSASIGTFIRGGGGAAAAGAPDRAPSSPRANAGTMADRSSPRTPPRGADAYEPPVGWGARGSFKSSPPTQVQPSDIPRSSSLVTPVTQRPATAQGRVRNVPRSMSLRERASHAAAPDTRPVPAARPTVGHRESGVPYVPPETMVSSKSYPRGGAGAAAGQTHTTAPPPRSKSARFERTRSSGMAPIATGWGADGTAERNAAEVPDEELSPAELRKRKEDRKIEEARRKMHALDPSDPDYRKRRRTAAVDLVAAFREEMPNDADASPELAFKRADSGGPSFWRSKSGRNRRG